MAKIDAVDYARLAPREYARTIEQAVLSKLRAEGVPVAGMPEYITDNRYHIQYRLGWNNCLSDCRAAMQGAAPVASAPADERAALQRIVDTAKDGSNSGDRHARCVEIARAALASAPVAWEARTYRPTEAAILEACDLLDKIKKSHGYWGGWSSIPSVCDEAIGLLRYSGTHAAPQANEAVRILFPAHLRKMWSGGEVQAWLDEHQGITPPKASVKGSLERYRKWQTEQTQADCAAQKGGE